MIYKSSLVFLIVCFCLKVQSQSLIGNWRRQSITAEKIEKVNNQAKSGDLTVRSDSTFHIEGDTLTQSSSVPGWHTGEELNGTWELKDKRLTFWLDPKENRMFLWFNIIALTKNKLVLRSGFNRNSKKHDITYIRL